MEDLQKESNFSAGVLTLKTEESIRKFKKPSNNQFD